MVWYSANDEIGQRWRRIMQTTPRPIHLRPIKPIEKMWAMHLVHTVMRSHVEQLWGWDQGFQERGFNDRTWAPHLSAMEVIEFERERVGWLIVRMKKDVVRLNALYVAPEFQGNGVGKAALDVIKGRAITQQLPLELSVLVPNRRAFAFYSREGFEVVSRTPERIYLRWWQP